MSDLIDRQKVLNTLDFADNALIGEGRTVETYKELLTECIKVLPSVEKNGEWIKMKRNKAEKHETCKGCLEPCIMYEPDMRGCKKKITER